MLKSNTLFYTKYFYFQFEEYFLEEDIDEYH